MRYHSGLFLYRDSSRPPQSLPGLLETSAMDKETIEKVALLARLRLTPEEVDSLQNDIGKILEYANLLESLDTENVEPLAHPGDIANALREDVMRDSVDRQTITSNSPKTDGEFYLVPAVMGESGKS